MAYERLLTALSELSTEQLQADVTLLDRGRGEIFRAEDTVLLNELPNAAVLGGIVEGGMPVIVF